MSAPERWTATAALVRALVVPVGLAFVAVLARRPDLLVLGAPLAVVGGLGLWFRPTQPPEILTSLEDRTVREGDGTHLVTTVGPPGAVEQVTRTSVAVPNLAVRPATGAVAALATPGHPAVVRLAVSPRRWGQRPVGEGQLAILSRWTGFRVGPLPQSPRPLTALPLVDHYTAQAPAPHPLGVVGAHRSRRQGSGTELAGIRPFQPGDQLRRVHWRSSLRSGRIHVVSTYAEEDACVWLVVDATADLGESRGVDGSPSTLDVGVRAAAAVADYHLRLGDRVGLWVLGEIGSGPARLRPGSGVRQQRRLLETLAGVHLGSSVGPSVGPSVGVSLRVGAGLDPTTPPMRPAWGTSGSITGSLSGASVAIAFSPLLDESVPTLAVVLARRGLATVVVDTLGSVPPPGERGDGPGDEVARLAWRLRVLEREVQLRRVARSGIPVVGWRGPGTLDDVLVREARRAAPPRVRR